MESNKIKSKFDASIITGDKSGEIQPIKGKYYFECLDKDGNLKWKDTITNVVTNVGANQILDSAFGSGPIAGPYLGLISSVGYTTPPAVGNTMSSHSGWNEAGNGVNYPNWSTPASNARGTMTFAVAGARAKALSTSISFVIATNAGTLKGGFVVFGTGAVATNNNTSGVLMSAGLFDGGDRVVGIGDTVNVSYEISLPSA
jgi:hypothetical protein